MLRLKLFLAFLVIVLYVQDGHGKDYSGYKLLKIPISSENDVAKLLALQDSNPNVNFWKLPSKVNNDAATCSVPPDEYEGFTGQLTDAGLTFTVKMDDLEKEVEKERAEVKAKSRLSVGGFDLFNYNRHSDINQYLDDLVGKCDSKGLLCETFSIGQSYEGREMKVIKIGSSGRDKPSIWIDAGIHAREWIAPATALVIANRLIFMYGTNGATTEVVDKFNWFILPSANPDGYEYSHEEDRFWRKTRSPNEGSDCVGTDPNRNWDYYWMETGASDDPCSQVYAGKNAFSEVETQAMSNFLINKTRNFVLYISLHAYGQYWLTPWGYTDEVPEDYNDLLDLGHTAADTIYGLYGKEFTVGSSTLVLYAAAGGSFDWTKAVAGINYSLAAELRDTGDHGFILPPSEIKQVGRETYLGIRAMAFKVAELKNIE